jgi:hypothetical protein
MGLKEDQAVAALIKSTEVMIIRMESFDSLAVGSQDGRAAIRGRSIHSLETLTAKSYQIDLTTRIKSY